MATTFTNLGSEKATLHRVTSAAIAGKPTAELEHFETLAGNLDLADNNLGISEPDEIDDLADALADIAASLQSGINGTVTDVDSVSSPGRGGGSHQLGA